MTPRTTTGKFRAIPSRCLDCGRVMRKRGKCPFCDAPPTAAGSEPVRIESTPLGVSVWAAEYHKRIRETINYEASLMPPLLTPLPWWRRLLNWLRST